MRAINIPDFNNGTYEQSLEAIFERLLSCPTNAVFADALVLMRAKDEKLYLILRNCAMSAYLVGRVDSYAEKDSSVLDRFAAIFGWIDGELPEMEK